MAENRVSGAVDRATDNTAFERAARAGHIVSGLVHLLIAFIIIRIAFGSGGNADQSGALGTLGSSPGGKTMLWIAAVAFLAMALWRVAEAIIGPHATEPGDGDSGASGLFDRAKAAGVAVVYFGFAFSAFQFARGTGQSSGQQSAGLSARLMENTAGKTVLVIAGLVVIAIGGYHVYKGVTKNFLDDLKISGGTIITPLGIAGYTAKGLVLIGAGILVIVASINSDPSKATGIDGAVKTLGEAPFGKFLLILAGIGIAAYGLYSFAMARYSRM
ncbi:DUF1206 domain-containing protein [Gordonia rubripertincta]|uniref:DUF1206 domain-containing protein n=1 Tax=Gordonia rubripertincta TaxID=36822 RepID=A0ABT4MXY0_GORRU|nr:DUF1206 domain-containing protein [Gordonia rubripertincta]MCZ4551560.1 DUF1206 domain-containing protein [Gordonia rubripertincta]